MKPVPGSVLVTVVLAVLANVAVLASLVAPSSAHPAMLGVAGALILATLSVGAIAATSRRRPRRTHPAIRLVAPPATPAHRMHRDTVVHAN